MVDITLYGNDDRMWHRYNRRYNLLLVGRQRFDVVGEVDVEALDAADTERQENSEAIAVQAAAGYTVNRRGAEIAGGDEGGQLDGDDANRLSIVGVAADVLREGGLGAVCFVKLLGDVLKLGGWRQRGVDFKLRQIVGDVIEVDDWGVGDGVIRLGVDGYADVVIGLGGCES